LEEYNAAINENFQKIFGSLKLKIEAKDGESIKIEDAFAKKGHSLTVWRDGINRKEGFHQHGHGVIRQALFNFLSFIGKSRAGTRKEYLILFEEPELYLHPEITFLMRNNLYDLAEKSPFQVVCATHSPMMIDLSKPHSSLVRVVKKANEETAIYQVGDEVFRSTAEKKSRVQMINRFNPHVCEAFFGNKVILVEGDTEAIVFRDLIGRLYPKHEIYVLNTGSKLNIAFFQEILTAFHIEHYVIHDADNRRDKNGDVNNVWTANKSIWSKIVAANAKTIGLATRYVMFGNFESAHGCTVDSLKGKPLAAYEFVSTLMGSEDLPCINYLSYIANGPPSVDGKALVHDQEFIEAQVPDTQP
jgi:putative ATP-dependent endonuclease of OLD family